MNVTRTLCALGVASLFAFAAAPAAQAGQHLNEAENHDAAMASHMSGHSMMMRHRMMMRRRMMMMHHHNM